MVPWGMKSIYFIALAFSLSLYAEVLPTQTRTEKADYWVKIIQSKLFGSADNAGLTLSTLGKKAGLNWKKLSSNIDKEMSSTTVKDNNQEDYKAEFERLTNARPTSYTKAEILVNGKASFARRKQMIDEAQESILFMSWAIYDDYTGKLHSDWLLEKIRKDPQIKIRIVVDGQIALQDHHFMELKRLERNSNGKIQIIRWITKRYRGNGTHRKIFIVDQKKVIYGGINVGDYYSHLNPEVPGWRDTDIYFEGDIAQKSSELFALIWNQQIAENNFDVEALDIERRSFISGTPMSLIDHKPGDKHNKADHNILMAYAKLISEAQVRVDIQNAYFIFNPVIKKAITKALNRGIVIRIMTNSGESVDEPVVSVPILESAKLASQMGAEVYLKKGTTLHSKFMIVDNKIVVLGSDNLHPRSQHFEGETMTVSFDEKLAQDLSAIYEDDIREARFIKSPEEIEVKNTFLSRLVKLLFFNHL